MSFGRINTVIDKISLADLTQKYIISKVVFWSESKSGLCFFPAHQVSEFFNN